MMNCLMIADDKRAFKFQVNLRIVLKFQSKNLMNLKEFIH